MIINKKEFYEIELQNIIYTSNMKANLLSTVTFYDFEYEVSMKSEKEVNIIKDNVIVGKTIRHGNIYKLQIIANFNVYSAIKIESESLDI